MAKRDHAAIVIDEFKGLYERGDFPVPPKGYMTKAQNVRFDSQFNSALNDPPYNGSVSIREGLLDHTNLTTPLSRFCIYERSAGFRIIYIRTGGVITDVTAGTNILTVATATDISGITLNDRFFFTVHDRNTGIVSQFVYLYDPSLSATARKIAGVPPGAGMLAAAGVAGTIEPGIHVYAVSFITNTGFITKPGSHVQFTTPIARNKTSLTVIPTGGASVVGRRIWMSQVVRHFDSNITAIPLFFIGDINDNVTTTATLDAYDSQLISSADSVAGLLPEVPAGLWLTMFEGRMVVNGAAADPYVLRISNQNQPESIDAVNGLREIDRYSGGAVRTTRGLRGNLHIWKSNRTYALKPNSLIPAEWELEDIDISLGAEVYGVSEVNNNPNAISDMLLVGNPAGLFVYDGSYNDVLHPLSYNIEKLWTKNSTRSDGRNITRVIVDSFNKRVYSILGGYSAGNLIWLMMDYTVGLSYDKVKWSNWSMETGKVLDIHVITPGTNIGDMSNVFVLTDQAASELKYIAPNSQIFGADGAVNFTVDIEVSIIDNELRFLHLDAIKILFGATYGSAGATAALGGYGVDQNGTKTGNDIEFNIVMPNFITTMVTIEKPFNVTGIIISGRIKKLPAQIPQPFFLSKMVLFIRDTYAEMPT